MAKNFFPTLRDGLHAARRRRAGFAVELTLLAAAGAVSGLMASRVPVLHQALQSAGLGRKVSSALLGSRFSVGGTPQTYVLVYTSPSCRFSVAAAPFHRQVVEVARAVGVPVYIAVRGSSDVAQYTKTGEFPGARFLPSRSLPVEPEATPTILLVRNNVVKRTWNGLQQTQSDRDEVLDTIAAAKTTEN